MKRSEMLQIILQFSNTLPGGTNFDKRGNRAEVRLIEAEAILDAIEAAGMQPPMSYKTDNVGIFYEVNEWEDEGGADETK